MPAGVTTLGAVRLASQERADMVNSTFVSTAEWNRYINASYQELYGLLVQKFGNDYFVKATPYSITTDGTNDHYALPDDFFKLLGVDLQVFATPVSWVTVDPFNFRERNRYTLVNYQALYGATSVRYRLNGSTLWLAPRPAAGQVFRVHYVPRIGALAEDADTLDGVNGWEEYIITDAAIKAKDKEESDVTVLAGQKAALIARIEAEAENRDATGVATTTDVRGWGGPGSYPDGGSWSGGWGW